MDLDSLSIEGDIGVSKDHVYRKYFWSQVEKSINMFFKNIKRWDIIKMFNKKIPGYNCIREETIHVPV